MPEDKKEEAQPMAAAKPQPNAAAQAQKRADDARKAASQAAQDAARARRKEAESATAAAAGALPLVSVGQYEIGKTEVALTGVIVGEYRELGQLAVKVGTATIRVRTK